jgi:hypothetical protein
MLSQLEDEKETYQFAFMATVWRSDAPPQDDPSVFSLKGSGRWEPHPFGKKWVPPTPEEE